MHYPRSFVAVILSLMMLLGGGASPVPGQQILAGLGSGSFTIDPSAVTALYQQDEQGISFGTVALGDTIGGEIPAIQAPAPAATWGLIMRVAGPNSDLHLTVGAYEFDGDYKIAAEFTGRATATAGQDAVFVPLTLVWISGSSRSITGLQLTWDGGGTIDATVLALAAATPPVTAPPNTPASNPKPTPTPTPTPTPASGEPSLAAKTYQEGAQYYREQYNQLGQPWLAESYYYYYAGIAKFIELAESGRYEEGVANYHFYQSFAQFCFYGHYGYYASAWYYFYNAQALGYYHWYASQGDLSLANWYYNDFVQTAQTYYQTLTAMGFQ